MVYFNFFNSPVDPKTMILVYHIIPYAQIRKVLDFFPFEGAVPLLFLLICTKNIRFRNDCKL